MKSLTKTLVVAGVVGTVGAGALAGGAVANAESGTNSGDPVSSLVDKIASTFNLDKSKVQQVFDQQRSDMEAKHEKELQSRLQALVDKGTITTAQKSAIEAKITELKNERKADRDTIKSMSDAEREAAMEKRRTDMETWAKEQGLDLSKLRGILGGPGGPRG